MAKKMLFFNCLFSLRVGDAWIYHLEENVWTELILKNCDKRLWHQSSYIDNQIIGGAYSILITNTILID